MTTPLVGYNQETNFYSDPTLSASDYAGLTSGNIAGFSGGPTSFFPEVGYHSGGYGSFGGDPGTGFSYGSGGFSYNDLSSGDYMPSGYNSVSFFGGTSLGGYGGATGGVGGGMYGDNVGYDTGYRPPQVTPETPQTPAPEGWVPAGPCNPGLMRDPVTNIVYHLDDNGRWVPTDDPFPVPRDP